MAPHCGIVCTSVSIVPAFKCPGSAYVFHLFIWRSRVSKTHKDFLDEATDQTLVESPLPLHFYPHNNHTSSLQTLLFQLLCVLRVYAEDPLLYGALMRPYPLKLYTGHVVFPLLKMFLARNDHAVSALRPPAFPWHHSSGDLTQATLSWRLFVCHFCKFRPSLCFFSLIGTHLSQELVREECGGTAVWHRWCTHTDTTEFIEGEGKSEKKVLWHTVGV